MTEAYANDFDDDTAFERLILERVAPITPTDMGTASSTYDVANDAMAHAIGLHETLGMTLPEAVKQLGIVPLAFGAAWKVIDLLLEHALAAAGHAPSRGVRWTILEKVQHARRGAGQAAPVSPDGSIWAPTLLAYAACEDVRHSLVHRRAEISSSGAIIGVDKGGASLRPLIEEEQLAFCRATQLIASAVIAGSLSKRERTELCWQLDQLVAVSGHPSSGVAKPLHPIPVIEVRTPMGQLDLKAVKARLRAGNAAATAIDVVFVLPTGERLCADLEDVPDLTTTLDPTALPSWVRLLPPQRSGGDSQKPPSVADAPRPSEHR